MAAARHGGGINDGGACRGAGRRGGKPVVSVREGMLFWDRVVCCAARRLCRRRRRWPLPWCCRRRRFAATLASAASCSAAAQAAEVWRPPQRRQAARSPQRHPRAVSVARPRRCHRCRRRRAATDGDTKGALGGGEGVPRRAACGGGNDSVVGAGVQRHGRERGSSMRVGGWRCWAGRCCGVAWRSGRRRRGWPLIWSRRYSLAAGTNTAATLASAAVLAAGG